MMEKSESVPTQAKPDACAKPRRRRCLDIEYKRQHGCADKYDVALIGISLFLAGFGLGIMFGIGG